jgi:hypothetical protein
MIAYIHAHKHRYGVEPICRVLPIAPSTYYQHTKRPRSARAVREAELKVEIRRVRPIPVDSLHRTLGRGGSGHLGGLPR